LRSTADRFRLPTAFHIAEEPVNDVAPFMIRIGLAGDGALVVE
jgi:hypothetical protein